MGAEKGLLIKNSPYQQDLYDSFMVYRIYIKANDLLENFIVRKDLEKQKKI